MTIPLFGEDREIAAPWLACWMPSDQIEEPRVPARRTSVCQAPNQPPGGVQETRLGLVEPPKSQ